VISGAQFDWDGTGSLVVRWTTDLAATARVDYGTTTDRTQTIDRGAALATTHSVTLSGLALDTTYYLRLRSESPAAAETSKDATFFTASGGGGGGGIVGLEPATIRGLPTAWHPLTLSFRGPQATELDEQPNPFLDYRMTVTLYGPSGQTLTVPGFFDGDGEGNGSGDVWRVRFAPDAGGSWRYEVSFVAGPEVAVSLDPGVGTPLAFHGAVGSLQIADRDPNAEGFYRFGKLEYVGEHYPKFRDGPYFIKGGTDSPENLLGYRGFDNTFDQPGGISTVGLIDGLHGYGDHVRDFGPGGLGDDRDPEFSSATTGYDSRGIVGALNYLASVGVNSVYFLPMNVGGDGNETTPFVGYANTRFDKTHYDISKLTQWNLVFEHAQRKGILLHFVLGETELANELFLDGGTLGVERKLFYRELVARFGHALAIKWNLCEESDFDPADMVAFAEYLRAIDPYDHPIAFHTNILRSSGHYAQYDAVLGDPHIDATSIQGDPESAGAHVEKWRNDSARAGRKWIVETDEQTPASTGLTDTNADELRKQALYDVLFSGGHIEWYAGYHFLPLGGDVRMENFRTRESMWNYMRHARQFMEQNLPFWEMVPNDSLLTGESSAYGGGEVFAKHGAAYAIYLPDASTTGQLDLSGTSGEFTMRWFDPRTGAFVGAPRTISGGQVVELGPAPGTSPVDIFMEENGLLVIECEAVAPTGSWLAETDLPGFAGAAYYRWNGPNDFVQPGRGVLRYHFEISTPGEYVFRIHNRHDHPDPDLENDAWVRVDDGNWVSVFSDFGPASVGVWNWDSRFATTNAPASYPLAAGRHTLEISGRSANFRIDRFHLFRSEVAEPLSLTHPQSSSTPGQAGTNEDWVVLLKK
jgi:hypothetical protein